MRKYLDNVFAINKHIVKVIRSMEEKLLTKRLREIRIGKKLTLEKVAKLTGLSKGYLSQIENSDQPPPIYTLSRI